MWYYSQHFLPDYKLSDLDHMKEKTKMGCSTYGKPSTEKVL